MKINKNAFTLIELLAVIVILAIIALIATPIILGVINDSKEQAAKLSVKNYIRAVELAVSNKYVKDPTVNLIGTYEIIENGEKIQCGTSEPIEVEFEGQGLINGTITLNNGIVTKIIGGVMPGISEIVEYSNGEVTFITEYEKSTLIEGASFNVKIKKLANPDKEIKNQYAEDTTIKSIEFYSIEQLPEGYNKKADLEKLPNVSVSSDNSIMAYYDNSDDKNKIYIVSDNLISFNETAAHMFYAFKAVTNINFYEIDTSQVTNMNNMFNGCNNLTSLDLSSFDTSLVTNMGSMFAVCSAITNITFGENFNTTQVTTMHQMFCNCNSLTSLDLSNFDTSSVKDAGMEKMFDGCSKLESINLGKNFKTSGVTSMKAMFYNCKALKTLDVSNWDVSNVTSMNQMFRYCSKLESLNVSNWNTESVTDMLSMFNSCGTLETLDVSNWNTSSVKDTGMVEMFYGCSALQMLDVSKWDTSNVTSMKGMFNSCGALETLDVSNWNTSKVTSMYQMFYGMSGLTSLNLSNFDTSKVEYMDEMFARTTNLTDIKIGCNWITASSNKNMFSSSAYTLDKLNTQIEEIKPACPVIN